MNAIRRLAETLFAGSNGKNGTAGRHEVLPRVASSRKLLFVSERDGDREALRQCLGDTRWELVSARDCGEGLGVLRSLPVPVALCERELPGADWHDSVRSLLASTRPVCVILVSPVVDCYLWEEVIQIGGFDVISRPFIRSEVVRTVDFALAHWNTGWVRRRWDHFEFKD